MHTIILPIRHPSDYKVIKKKDVEISHFDFFYKCYRLQPNFKIPEGYEELKVFNRKSIYEESGRLTPKFWSLKRWREKKDE